MQPEQEAVAVDTEGGPVPGCGCDGASLGWQEAWIDT